MTINEKINRKDRIDINLKMLELTGVKKQRIRKMRIFYAVCVLIGLGLVIIEILQYRLKQKLDFMEMTFLLLGVLYASYSCFKLVNAEKADKKRLIKSYNKTFEMLEKQYDISLDNVETVTEIKDDCIESISMGTTTKYLKKDFVKYFEDDAFYILEFTVGRYLFFKKDIFSTQEEFLQIIKEIQD